MSDEQPTNPFEDALRAMARDLQRSIDQVSSTDWEALARANGLDPDRAREWIDQAGTWLRGHVDPAAPRTPARTGDPLAHAGPHPLDVPTEEQGLALAALESGRWTIEPGTSALTGHGDGPGPTDARGVFGELRVRGGLDADGEVTLAGHHALGRWLERADRD